MTASDEMRIGSVQSDRASIFRDMVADEFEHPYALEIGTLRWDPDFPTHHKSWVPDASTYVMTDIAAGTDVDIVSDAHRLGETFGKHTVFPRRFDVVIAVSVWEHLRRPWVAMESVHDIMFSEGLLYIATHQTFPLHGYPDDYYRFSDQALRTMAEDAGFEVVEVGYTYPCSIVPGVEIERWNEAAESYLNVDIVARRR